VDHAALFAAAPSPYAVVDPDLVVVEVNGAYCAVTGRSREQLLGTKLIESFPDDPAGPGSRASAALLESLHRVLSTGQPDTMAPQRYDVADAAGGYVERYWSIVNVPVLDPDGRVALVLNRPAEITALVLDEDRGAGAGPRPGIVGEGEVFLLARELQAALRAEAAVRARLAAVSDVALQLSRARTVADLVGIVIERGLAALGADGGAVAVRAGDHLDLTLTSSLGEHTGTAYSRLPLDGSLPACVAAATGSPVVLPDREACLAWAPEMTEVVAETGCQAWIALPLQTGDTSTGSLTIGWRAAREFPTAEVEVLQTLAAQCSHGLERIRAHEAEQRAAGQTRRMSETLQRSMLTAPFQPDHLELAVRYVPAAHDAFIGGDWYDAFMSRDGALCVAVGDVAGHDREAAAVMGQLRNLLRGIAYALDEPPAAILDTLDGAMRQLSVPAVATAIFGKVEQTPRHGPGQRTFRWTNAGHPPPLLLGPDGALHLLGPHDRLLGTTLDLPRTDHTQLLEPGSTLLLYTDGLVERRGADLDTGFDWLLDAVAGLAHGTLDELCDGLLAAIGDVDDDVALLAVRAHPEDEPRPPEAGPQVLPRTGGR
jgi:serine phosphatase RsbU (regulator of sigma subunit)